MDNNLKTILKLIEEAKIITIFGHINPDGDCYGSQIGLKNLLKENFQDKEIYALGSGFKKMLSTCGELDLVDDEKIKSSLALVLDASSSNRVEDKRFLLAPITIQIDHHVKMDEFTTYSYVVEDAISTTEIITDLSIMWNLKMDEKVATPLLLGLLTDSGRFLYPPYNKMFDTASYLLNKGADIQKIYDNLYLNEESSLKLKGFYYTKYKKRKGVIYVIFHQKDLEKLNVSASEAAVSVNLLSSIDGYPIWAAFSENPDGTIKAEFRSNSTCEVAEIAISHGGGGHRCASGCTLSSKEEIPLVLKELEYLASGKGFYDKVLKDMIKACFLARKKILEVYATDFDVEIKDDNSPVTLADKGADQIIRTYLHKKYPNYAFLTEESVDDLNRLNNPYCFIVDPVDGTADFVDRNGEFTTNIALCFNHEIVVGVVSIPVTKDIYYASRGYGTYHMDSKGNLNRCHVTNKTSDLTLYISRFHATDQEKKQIEEFKEITKMEAHGSSLKACYIAEGRGELYYRLSEGTKEWDTAAIQLIVEQAGGYFLKPDGTRYKYNRVDVYNRKGFIIVNLKENILIK